MRGAVAKAHRRTAREGATMAARAVAPALEAVVNNEEINRRRLDALEPKVGDFLARGLGGRLRWLFLGR